MDEFARAEAILAILERAGRVTVSELTRQLNVSAVTVRKDLESLEQRAMLRRVRGGAVGITSSDEGSFDMRLRQGRAVKRSIAEAVAGTVGNGEIIAMDASTTCYYLAERLLERRDLIVITNGLKTATLFLERSSAMVVMPGGVLRRSAGSMVGQFGDVLAARGTIDKGFFGVKGLSVTHGLMEMAIEEAEAKKHLVSSCASVYGLFDSSKVGRFGLHSFAPVASLTGLYTDDRMPAADITAWRRAGVGVTTVPHAGSEHSGEHSRSA
jgi:DeoR/GlpR family transcriptional regulator of sugar metabolism